MSVYDNIVSNANVSDDDQDQGPDFSKMTPQQIVAYNAAQMQAQQGQDPDAAPTPTASGAVATDTGKDFGPTAADAPSPADVGGATNNDDTLGDSTQGTPKGMHLSSLTTRTSSNPTTYMQTPPSDDEVMSVMQQIQQVRKQATTPADYSAINKAEADAKELYQDRANRADWSQVAELIGNAGIKFAQANAAVNHHVDVSQMKDMAPIDWDKKKEQAFGDYREDVGTQEKQREAQRLGQSEQDKLAQEDYQNQLTPLQAQAKFLQDKYNQESSDYRRGLQDSSRDNRMLTAEQFREDRQGQRQSQSDDKQLRSLQAKDLQSQIAQNNEQGKNATAAAQYLSQQDSLDPKTLQKLEAQSPGLLGRAGISPEQLADINQKSQVPGRFYGTNTDPDVRNKLIQSQVLAPIQQKQMTLRDALSKVLGNQGQGSPGGTTGGSQGGQSTSGQSTSTPNAQTTAPKTVSQAQLSDYAGQHFNGNIQAASKFLTDSGYTIGQ